MASVMKTDLVDIELHGTSIYRSNKKVVLGEGDNKANRFGVRIFRDGISVSVTGYSCIGYFVRNSNRETVVINGSIQNNQDGQNIAYVTLPQACYAVEGSFSLLIKLVGNGETVSVRIVDGIVVNSTTETMIDPGSVVPDISDLLAQINRLEQVTEAAQNVVDNSLTKNDVVNDLVTETTDVPLSAYQGKQLKDYVDSLNDSISNYEDRISALEEGGFIGGGGGSGGQDSNTQTVHADVTYMQNLYCRYTDGAIYADEGSLASNFIPIPDGVNTITIKGIGRTNAMGYCFYSQSNYSYSIAGSGATMKATDVTTFNVAVPSGAKYVIFTTRVGYESQSGVSYKVTTTTSTGGGSTGGNSTEGGSTVVVTDSSNLPDYYMDEIRRVGGNILDTIGLDDIVFGVYTDIHFDNDYNSAYEPNMRELRAMNELANKYPLDLTIDGGDLLTYCTYEFSKKCINDDMNAFSNCRVPHLIAKGDHDSAQKDTLINKNEWAARTYPYMPMIVRCETEPNNYYYDIPNKKVRFIVIDTGSAMAGQSGEGFAMNMEAIYTWMLSDVFTDEVKNGWRFVIFSHAPHDWEWNIGMVKRGKLSGVRRNQVILLDILDALNNSIHYHQDAVTTQQQVTVYRGSNGVLSTSGTAETYTMGRFNVTLDKDFSGWTSKVMLICSGHTHCDRLNKVTNGVTKSYAIAYTGSAQYNGYKGDDNGEYYTNCFGTDGACASWLELQNRSVGTISEALMDVFHIKGNDIYTYRFGIGSDKHITLD